MIKLFRHIRQRLFVENPPAGQAGKFSRYLIYAIGEIILVMIGILLALQVNNLNEELKNKKIKKVYINKLIDDINADIVSYEQNKSDTEKRIEFAKYIMGIIDNARSIEDNNEFVMKLQIIGRINFPDKFNTTFLDLQNTGNFKLFSNDSIINAVQSYYITDNDFWKELYIERTTKGLLPLVTNAIPFHIQEQIINQEIKGQTIDTNIENNKFPLDVTNSDIDSILDKISGDPQFQFHLKNATRAHLLQIRYNLDFIKAAKNLLQLLNQLKGK